MNTDRHPELVSGSNWTCAPWEEDWMLKQVQHEDLTACPNETPAFAGATA
jgi:hypothetical protein